MTAAVATGGGRFDFVSVQYLRAVAASMVVVYHLAPQLKRFGVGAAWGDWLSSGVDIFFVISGFIMWATTSGREVTPVRFILKRLIRIAPLYYLLTAFIILVMLLKPSWLQSSKFDSGHVIFSFLFLPSVHPVLGAIEPVLIPGWTLNYEMFFYVIFAAALFFVERIRLFLMLFVLVALGCLGALNFDGGVFLKFYLNSIVLEFGLGVILAFLVKNGIVVKSPVVSILLVVLGFLLIYFLSTFKGDVARLVMWGLPSCLIVYGAVCLDIARATPNWRWLHLLGDASYSIYLFHGIVLSAVSQGWRWLFPLSEASVFCFCLVAVALSLTGGVVLYSFVERPLNRRLTSAWA